MHHARAEAFVCAFICGVLILQRHYAKALCKGIMLASMCALRQAWAQELPVLVCALQRAVGSVVCVCGGGRVSTLPLHDARDVDSTAPVHSGSGITKDLALSISHRQRAR